MSGIYFCVWCEEGIISPHIVKPAVHVLLILRLFHPVWLCGNGTQLFSLVCVLANTANWSRFLCLFCPCLQMNDQSLKVLPFRPHNVPLYLPTCWNSGRLCWGRERRVPLSPQTRRKLFSLSLRFTNASSEAFSIYVRNLFTFFLNLSEFRLLKNIID